MDFIVGKGVVSSEEHFRPFESVHNYIGNILNSFKNTHLNIL